MFFSQFSFKWLLFGNLGYFFLLNKTASLLGRNWPLEMWLVQSGVLLLCGPGKKNLTINLREIMNDLYCLRFVFWILKFDNHLISIEFKF